MADPNAPIVIIGAGASGMMAAISASRVHPHPIVLLEKEDRPGRKLLATGNGRCNLMNLRVEAGRFHGGGAHAALSLLSRLGGPSGIGARFAALGLRLREEPDGRVYPFSGQANAVLDVLRAACARSGIAIRTQACATDVTPLADGFAITLATGERVHARRLILAGGGMASPSLGGGDSALAIAGALGHTAVAPFPAIVPLLLPAARLRGLKGIRMPARLSLLAGETRVQQEAGEVLFADYGLSGIAAMQLARRVQVAMAARQPVALSISFLDADAARAEMALRVSLCRDEPAAQLFAGLLPRRLGETLLKKAGIPAQAAVSEAMTGPLAALLSDWRLPVEGTRPFAQAQVMAGGLTFAEFDPETLASHRAPGLYACGEAMDVDGDCGGYNLLWAWVSGIVAGEACAASIQTNRRQEVP